MKPRAQTSAGAPFERRSKRSEKADAMLETLRRQGLRITRQRVAIVDRFAGDESHPTAQDLFERLRPAFPSMSFATVYNTLDALARAELSSTLHLGGAARFDPNVTPHHHAVCEACGEVLDVPVRSLEPEAAGVARVHDVAPGFAVSHVEKIYRGTCSECRALASSGRPGSKDNRKKKEN